MITGLTKTLTHSEYISSNFSFSILNVCSFTSTTMPMIDKRVQGGCTFFGLNGRPISVKTWTKASKHVPCPYGSKRIYHQYNCIL